MKLIAKSSRLFKSHGFGRGPHPGFQVAFNRCCITLQERLDPLDHLTIIRFKNESPARTVAAFDVVVETELQLVFSNRFIVDAVFTGADSKDIANYGETRPQCFDIGVGTIIDGAVLDDFPGYQHLGKIFPGNTDVGITFIIP